MVSETPKNIIWVIYRIKQLRNYKKKHGVLRGPQLGKQRWRPKLGILRVKRNNAVHPTYICIIFCYRLCFMRSGYSNLFSHSVALLTRECQTYIPCFFLTNCLSITNSLQQTWYWSVACSVSMLLAAACSVVTITAEKNGQVYNLNNRNESLKSKSQMKCKEN